MKKEKEEGKTPCMGYGHPVLGKIFKMFEFWGFTMLTFPIEPFWIDRKKFSFYEKKVEKN